MKIAIRTDANGQIATGHLFRCLAIASHLTEEGAEVVFVFAEPEVLSSYPAVTKYPCRVLNSDWRRPDSEIQSLIRLLREEQTDLLLVDTYFASSFYLAVLHKHLPVVYFDDLAKEIYDVSMLIHCIPETDYGRYLQRYRDRDTEVCCGLEYCPMRDEFRNCSRNSERPRRILITTGGTDPLNLQYRLLDRFVRNSGLASFCFTAVSGALNVNYPRLRQLEELYPERVTVLRNTMDMAELMKNSMLAVSACGTTLYEMCACGLPAVAFAIADNQLSVGRTMHQLGLIRYCGDARSLGIEESVEKNLEEMIADPEKLQTMGREIQLRIDGRGTDRICRKIIGLCSSPGTTGRN